MITCQKATKMSSLFEDGQLAFFDKLKYKMHISMCKVCARFDSQVKLIIKEFKRIDTDTALTSAEKEKLKNLILKKLHKD